MVPIARSALFPALLIGCVTVQPAAATGEWILWNKSVLILPNGSASAGDWKIEDASESRSQCNAYIGRKHDYWARGDGRVRGAARRDPRAWRPVPRVRLAGPDPR